MRNVAEAQRYAQRFIELEQARKYARGPLLDLTAYYSLALNFIRIEEDQLSLDYLQRGLSLHSKNSATHSPEFQNLFTAAQSLELDLLHRLDEAEFLRRTASIPDDAHPLLVHERMEKMGFYYLEQGQYDRAEASLESASELGDRLRKFYNYDVERVKILVQTGRYDQAKETVQAIITDAFKKGYARNVLDLPLVYADLQLRTGHPDSAYQFAQIALHRLGNRPDLTYPPLATDLPELPSTYNRLTEYLRIMETAYRAAPHPDTRHRIRMVIQTADQFHDRMIARANLLRRNANTTLVDRSLALYRQIIRNIGAFEDPSSTDADLFYYVQKLKAQHLWGGLLQAEARRVSDIDSTLLQREYDLTARITFLETLEKSGNTARTTERRDLLRERTELIREIELKYPDYHAAKYDFLAETTSSTAAQLGVNELLLEYTVLDSHLLVFAIAKDADLRVAQIPLSENFAELAQTYHRLLRDSPLRRPASRARFTELSYALYQQLLAPFATEIDRAQRLILIGDGPIHLVPCETLISNPAPRSFAQLPYLLRSHEVSYHYSATLFVRARQLRSERGSGLYAFAPVYDYDQAVSVRNPGATTLRARDAEGSYQPLPESEVEVKRIANLYALEAPGAPLTVALRKQATEASLRDGLRTTSGVVHIAGHSFADVSAPKFSGIACYETSDDPQADGTLYTNEIYNLRAAPDLVTLSSCESGLGKLDGTEGLLGLNRAFLYAGAPNVQFSLWKVYDKVSSKLMVEFYRNVLTDADYATSLRRAKLAVLEDPRTCSPHFWGPYLLIGR